MNMDETTVHHEPKSINRRLAELGLHLKGLNKVREAARGASANATSFHPANAAGTFAYQYGTWALRDSFVDDDWKSDNEDGVEAICNDSLRVKVIFANVDLACCDAQPPKPRSRKGAGAERACSGNLFGSLPIYAPRQSDDSWKTYYFMLDGSGDAELTRPIIKGSTFSAYVERIYLPHSDEFESQSTDLNRKNDELVDLDPIVARK